MTDVRPAAAVDFRFRSQPNPFATRTTFRYRLQESGPVSLAIYDLTGRRVAQVVDAVLPAGPHEAAWDLCAHPEARQGVLFARLVMPGETRTLPLIIAR